MSGVLVTPQPQVFVQGPIRAGLVEYARRRVSSALRYAPRPVLFVRITLRHCPTRGESQPWSVAVHADVSGVDIHVSATAATFAGAVDQAQQRLLTRLSRTTRWR